MLTASSGTVCTTSSSFAEHHMLLPGQLQVGLPCRSHAFLVGCWCLTAGAVLLLALQQDAAGDCAAVDSAETRARGDGCATHSTGSSAQGTICAGCFTSSIHQGFLAA
jgi:hypothetical protein